MIQAAKAPWRLNLSTSGAERTGCNMNNIPQQTGQPNDWRFPMVMGLAIGIGMPVARNVASAFWPGLVNEWGVMTVNAVAAGVVAGVVALIAGGVLKLFRKSKSVNVGGGRPERE